MHSVRMIWINRPESRALIHEIIACHPGTLLYLLQDRGYRDAMTYTKPLWALGIMLVLNTAAADQVVQPREPIGGGGAEDLLHMTQPPPGLEEKKQPSLGFTTSCTTQSGTILKEGEAGYDDCLDGVKQEARPQRSGKTAPDGTRGVGAGFKFGSEEKKK
jgi:hypothetical protein